MPTLAELRDRYADRGEVAEDAFIPLDDGAPAWKKERRAKSDAVRQALRAAKPGADLRGPTDDEAKLPLWARGRRVGPSPIPFDPEVERAVFRHKKKTQRLADTGTSTVFPPESDVADVPPYLRADFTKPWPAGPLHVMGGNAEGELTERFKVAIATLLGENFDQVPRDIATHLDKIAQEMIRAPIWHGMVPKSAKVTRLSAVEELRHVQLLVRFDLEDRRIQFHLDLRARPPKAPHW